MDGFDQTLFLSLHLTTAQSLVRIDFSFVRSLLPVRDGFESRGHTCGVVVSVFLPLRRLISLVPGEQTNQSTALLLLLSFRRHSSRRCYTCHSINSRRFRH